MKRIGDLYDKITSYNNIVSACNFASKGKRKRRSVMRILEQKEPKLKFLQQLLVREEYHPMPYSKKTIIDRCTNKIRDIYIPHFYPDQIVQWALMNVIKPIIKSGMYDYSCASIDGRGGLYGVRTVQKWLTHDAKNTKYCLVIDIRKFYPSIDQDTLIEQFERKIKCKQTLALITKIIRSVPSGLPIGNFTSQWFANFYLQDFDHYVKEQLHIAHYIRYMDDMVFFGANKRELHKQQKIIEAKLNSLHLSIKPNWQIFKIASTKSDGRALDFLGYKFYRNHITMRGRTFLRTTRRIHKCAKKDYLTSKDASAVMSYVARINVTSGNRLYNTYVKPYINCKVCRESISRHDKLAHKMIDVYTRRA